MITAMCFLKATARKFFALLQVRITLPRLLGVLVFAFSVGQAQATTFPVSNLSDSGVGSLRQAMLDANATPNSPLTTPDRIELSAGTGTITLVTALPAITDSVQIINLDTGSGRIEINGLATRSGLAPSIGFDVQAPDCEIWGFAINRFGEAGIRVGVGGDGTIIHQNYIGTDIFGLSANCPDAANPCGNINRGIWVDGAANVQIGVGGSGGHSNTISGNLGHGISINSAFGGKTPFPGSAIVRNNYIGGTNASGNTDIGNTQDGILVAGSSGTVIGGTASNDRNFILGNGGNGISVIADVDYPASGTTIKGNYIGYTLGTNQAVGNDGSGIVIQAASTVVGGTSVGDRNIIVGNKVNGITINSSFATGNVVQGNYIGTGDGSNALGNGTNGVQISNYAADNTIGGTGVTPGTCNGACNIIANNGEATKQTAKAGIYLDPTARAGNSIRGNWIFNSGGIGIDLSTPGTTADDSGDSDIGPNDLQNFPVLGVVSNSGSINGTLNSTSSTNFAIEFFLNTSVDGTTSEGRTYVGTTNVTTNASGNASFSFTSTVTLPVGQFVTATATVLTTPFAPQTIGSTSEFSAPAQVVAPTAALVPVGGKIAYAGGGVIKGVIVTLLDTRSGLTYTTTTNGGGRFVFEGISVGEIYIVTPHRKGLTFNPDSEVFSLTGARSDVNFVGAMAVRSASNRGW